MTLVAKNGAEWEISLASCSSGMRRPLKARVLCFLRKMEKEWAQIDKEKLFKKVG